MFELLKVRKKHGYQAVPNLRTAEPSAPFRGFPLIDESKCADGAQEAAAVCPTGALSLTPLRIDMGQCTFCGQCARQCPQGIQFSTAHRLASTDRTKLVIAGGQNADDFAKEAVTARREIKRLFGRSLRFRQVSAGGCNGCEYELNACNNVNFDMGRLGIDFVASPRHADGLMVTGPITGNMAPALLDAWHSLAEPKVLILVGACAISGGLFAESKQLDRSGLATLPVDLFIPGCPPHPLTIINALLDFLGKR